MAGEGVGEEGNNGEFNGGGGGTGDGKEGANKEYQQGDKDSGEARADFFWDAFC